MKSNSFPKITASLVLLFYYAINCKFLGAQLKVIFILFFNFLIMEINKKGHNFGS